MLFCVVQVITFNVTDSYSLVLILLKFLSEFTTCVLHFIAGFFQNSISGMVNNFTTLHLMQSPEIYRAGRPP